MLKESHKELRQTATNRGWGPEGTLQIQGSRNIEPLRTLFEGVCVNYRNPGPRRGEPRVGSAPDVAFPVDRADPLQNSGRPQNGRQYHDFGTFSRKIGTHFQENH